MASTLFIDDGGTGGRPVVLLHSSAGNVSHWAGLLPHLRRTRRALALDLPGHGRSPAPPRWSIPDQAEQVAETLTASGIRDFVLVGHSLGGAISVALAGAHPERVAGLFLLDPAADGRAIPAEAASGLMRKLRSDAYQATADAYWETLLVGARPATRQRLFADLHATAPVAITEALGALIAFDPLTPLRAYRGPRLSLFTPVTDQPHALHALIPELPRQRLDGVSHWPQFDDPAAVERVTDEFLARL
jgi:pimeloyl-ACP methyl ester carboxylesterase